VLDFEISDTKLDNPAKGTEVITIANQTVLAKNSGTAKITAIGYNENGEAVKASVDVHVLGEDDDGYYGGYTPPEVSKFEVTGYETLKAFYSVDNSDREIGYEDASYSFGGSKSLKMYPSEKVQLEYEIRSYYPDKTKVEFSVGNDAIATVNDKGEIVAVAKGSTIVSVEVYFYDEEFDEYVMTPFSERIAVTVKDPFNINMIYLMSYKGDEEVVTIPENRGITTIYSFAFSGYEYVEKDLTAGFAPELRPKAHHWLILHGRYTCTARKPKCDSCGLQDICQEYISSHLKV
jgi:hypothetical protein